LTVDALPKGSFTITFEHYKGEADKKFNMGVSIYAKKKVVYKQSAAVNSPKAYNEFNFPALKTINDGKGLVTQGSQSSPLSSGNNTPADEGISTTIGSD
jgi:hypothetical protein